MHNISVDAEKAFDQVHHAEVLEMLGVDRAYLKMIKSEHKPIAKTVTNWIVFKLNVLIVELVVLSWEGKKIECCKVTRLHCKVLQMDTL